MERLKWLLVRNRRKRLEALDTKIDKKKSCVKIDLLQIIFMINRLKYSQSFMYNTKHLFLLLKVL